MKLPELKIGELTAKIPVIQGGMGIGISLNRLAGTVAAEGGIGDLIHCPNWFPRRQISARFC